MLTFNYSLRRNYIGRLASLGASGSLHLSQSLPILRVPCERTPIIIQVFFVECTSPCPFRPPPLFLPSSGTLYIAFISFFAGELHILVLHRPILLVDGHYLFDTATPCEVHVPIPGHLVDRSTWHDPGDVS